MGMGEPLANMKAVPPRCARSMRRGATASARERSPSRPWGCTNAIERRFAEFDLPVTLALSLHAPNDELRRTLIPWSEYAPIDELLDACDAYFRTSGREITLEYLLLRDVNDRVEHARELAAISRRIRANINLIRYNEVDGLPYERPATEDVRRFQDTLRRAGLNVHIRASRGRDIAAACGQLRHEARTP
jgi:23S rRNA (adenine2503-C2)-methyltransferase